MAKKTTKAKDELASEKLNVNRKKKEFNPDDYILVQEMEPWLQQPIDEKFCDKDFFRIVLFYVLYSPCKNGSYSRTNLSNYGWKNPWQSSKFRRFLIDCAGLSKDNFISVDAQSSLKNAWENSCFSNKLFFMLDSEMAIFKEAGENNKFFDLFHRIRNSLAHGRFTAKKINREYYIYMEDVKNSFGQYCVTARIVLKRSTLVKWIDCFEVKTKEAERIRNNMFHIEMQSQKRGDL